MAKITNKDRAEILKRYADGCSTREIAKSLQVSHTAISKILNEIRSCHEEGKVDKSLQKVAKQSNKEIAREIYDNAMRTLKERVTKATATELMKVIEYYNILYNFAEEGSDEKVTSIAVTVEDGSGEDGTKD